MTIEKEKRLTLPPKNKRDFVVLHKNKTLSIMGLKCGIVGLPNVGKSTLFNCLSNAQAKSANFPFCTIEPQVGMINVPDNRLEKLEELVNPQRVVPTVIEIVDIAGLVKGASKGEGLGNKFLANIRETDAILHVLRCFNDDNIVHVHGKVDPISDKEIIDFELQLKDLETVESMASKNQRAAKTGDKEAIKKAAVYERLKAHLEKGKSARSLELEDFEVPIIDEMFLLTNKPVLYVCNVDETSAAEGNEYVESVKKMAEEENAQVLFICAGLEADVAQLDSYEERMEFLNDVGLKEAGVNKLIRSAYKLLNLSTYFTAGVQEVRAWTIPVGATAPQAAGVIHTDFERGFIKAEVMKYEDFTSLGSEAACREAGKLNMQGKEYLVEDGDIMHFKFNV